MKRIIALCLISFLGALSVKGQTTHVGFDGGIVSADGRFVIASDGDTGAIYEIELATGKKTLINVNINGDISKGYVDSISVSADGRYVAFGSTASDLVELKKMSKRCSREIYLCAIP